MKKLIATATLFGVIIINTTTAQAGMLLSDLFGGTETPAPCATRDIDVKVPTVGVDSGIIVKLVGIIVKAAEEGVASNGCENVDYGIMLSD